MMQSILDLNSDCLLAILSFLSSNERKDIRCVCRRFRALSQEPSLWRKVELHGHVFDAISCMRFLVRKRLASNTVHLILRQFDPMHTMNPDSELQMNLYDLFIRTINMFLSHCGERLQSFGAIDNDSSMLFDSGSHSLLKYVPRKCPNLSTILLGGGIGAIHYNDSDFSCLTSGCKDVRRFIDEQEFGVSELALNSMIKSWSELEYLSLNTGFMSVGSFFRTIAQFQGLTYLKVTHFRQTLSDKKAMNNLCKGISRLTSLKTLCIDFENTNRKEGFTADHWSRILEAAPFLRSVEYRVHSDAYFDEDTSDGTSFPAYKKATPRTVDAQGNESESFMGSGEFVPVLRTDVLAPSNGFIEYTGSWSSQYQSTLSFLEKANMSLEQQQKHVKYRPHSEQRQEFLRVLDGTTEVFKARGVDLVINWTCI